MQERWNMLPREERRWRGYATRRSYEQYWVIEGGLLWGSAWTIIGPWTWIGLEHSQGFGRFRTWATWVLFSLAARAALSGRRLEPSQQRYSTSRDTGLMKLTRVKFRLQRGRYIDQAEGHGMHACAGGQPRHAHPSRTRHEAGRQVSAALGTYHGDGEIYN